MSEFKLLDHTAALVLLFKEAPYCLHSGVSISHSRPQGTGSRFSACSPTLAVPWIWAAAVPTGGSLCSSLKPAIRGSIITDTCCLSPVFSLDGHLLHEKRLCNSCGSEPHLCSPPASGLSPLTLLQDRDTSVNTPACLWLLFIRLPL